MTREEFIKMCGIFGIGLPLQFSLMSCASDNSPNNEPFSGKVIVIGAGAGGLSAGYLLQQQGVDFEILEASANYGGRMKINTSFADFPIPLGAEWLETGTNIFQEIVNDSTIQVDIETVPDNPDRKFVNYSWYSFYQEYIVPSISSKISYNTIVQSIDYSGDQVRVNTQNEEYVADKVIIAVPLKMLQDGAINFTPSLPQSKLDTINSPVIWDGFKAFFEFSTKFYNDEYTFEITPETDGQKLYYDATLGQNTSKSILGLFTVGTPALDYINRSGDDLRNFMLNELDGIFSNQATPNYINHITQNWNNEPFIKSGYMSDYADWKVVRELGKSVAGKLFFAGGAFTDGNDWVSVHTAAQSAKKAIQELNN
ncbi:FAD-dependent oxidoreductase [Spongiivirga sp. MCCC 1A20706]|uniref:flavin monoamine oxidase family protein n=1 Tax=Spongiivirga sp. MCCC 1A20706 TaxID=3160963 RepID=UPI003977693C